MKFIKGVSIRNKNTAKQYYSRLTVFEKFVNKEYEINIDKLIQKLKSKEYDPYDILNDFCVFLQNNYNLSSVSFRDKIVTVKTFFEYNDIEISPRKFKLKVRFPKAVLRHKEAVDKEDIIKILNGCSDLRLKTYVMLLAATGCRAVEALSIRVKDLDFESNPAKLRIRGQYTKTKVDRYVFLTKEVIEQIKIWIDYKYRKRRICYKDKETGENYFPVIDIDGKYTLSNLTTKPILYNYFLKLNLLEANPWYKPLSDVWNSIGSLLTFIQTLAFSVFAFFYGKNYYRKRKEKSTF